LLADTTKDAAKPAEKDVSESVPAGYTELCDLTELRSKGVLQMTVAGNSIVVFLSEDADVFAFDNKCPHTGYPLSKGTLREGVLTCHWHHARFGVATRGALDLFADYALVLNSHINLPLAQASA